MQARAIASYAGESLKATKVAIVYEDTAFGAPLAKGDTAALAKLNRKVELSEAVDNKTTNFAAFVAKLKAARPEVLVAMVPRQPAAALVRADERRRPRRASRDRDQRRQDAAARERCHRQDAVPDLELGRVLRIPRRAEFGRKFRAAYHSDPVWAAHYAYDAVFVLADSIRRAESVAAPDLRAKLMVIDAVAPVTTTMRFNAQGEQRYGAIGVYQRRDARWEPLVRTDRW